MNLFIDTESTGLANFKLSSTDSSQPHICQLAAILASKEGETKAELNLLIRPADWVISEEVTKIHGITQSDAEKYGVSLKGAMAMLWRLLENTEIVVGHNISFDFFLLRVAAHRCGLPELKDLPLTKFCTMEKSKSIVRIPPTEKMKAAGFKTFKSPTLQETYTHFFKEPFEKAHDAMADTRACMKIFYELQNNRGHLEHHLHSQTTSEHTRSAPLGKESGNS